MDVKLVDQEYWDEGYNKLPLTESDDNVISEWIKTFVPPTYTGTCFEVGCFPGRFLTTLGRLGYELHGLDLTPRVVTEFPLWLKERGFRTGTFVQQDFLDMRVSRTYSVVCSFGFIEHFSNWVDIFEKHLEMVEPGGYLIIETPNFRGALQRAIHFFLDRENYRRHYIPAMSPGKWRKICEKRGFNVLICGYLGSFQFWVDKEPTGFLGRKVFNRLIRITPRLQKLRAGKKLYSPYCGIIAQRSK